MTQRFGRPVSRSLSPPGRGSGAGWADHYTEPRGNGMTRRPPLSPARSQFTVPSGSYSAQSRESTPSLRDSSSPRGMRSRDQEEDKEERQQHRRASTAAKPHDAPGGAGEPDQFVAVTAHCCELQSVHWSAVCRASGFDSARPCNQILSLDLGGNMVSHLAGMECYPWLLSLSLAQNDLRSLEAKRLPFTLTHLNLSHNMLTSLEGLESMPHLAWLDASHNAIEDVQPLAMLFQLKELHLGSNNIVNLEGLEGLKDLSLLELHDNQLADELEIRVALTPLANLVTMTLAGNPFAARPKRLRSLCIDLLPGLMWLDGAKIGRVATCCSSPNKYAVLSSGSSPKNTAGRGGPNASASLPPLFAHLPPDTMLLPQQRACHVNNVRPGTMSYLENLLQETAAVKGLQWVMHASANMFKAQPAELLDGRSGDKRPPAPRDPSWRHQAAVNKHVRRQQAAQLREASPEEELQGHRSSGPLPDRSMPVAQAAFTDRRPRRGNSDTRPWSYIPNMHSAQHAEPATEVLRGLAGDRQHFYRQPPPQSKQDTLWQPVVSPADFSRRYTQRSPELVHEERVRPPRVPPPHSSHDTPAWERPHEANFDQHGVSPYGTVSPPGAPSPARSAVLDDDGQQSAMTRLYSAASSGIPENVQFPGRGSSAASRSARPASARQSSAARSHATMSSTRESAMAAAGAGSAPPASATMDKPGGGKDASSVQHVYVRMDDAFISSLQRQRRDGGELEARGMQAPGGPAEEVFMSKIANKGRSSAEELLAMLDAVVEKKHHYLAELESLGSSPVPQY